MDHTFYEGFEEFTPQWAPAPPGRLLQAELEARHWSQAELASRISVSKKHLNQLVKGAVPLSGEMALALERSLDVPARLWLRIEADWRAHQISVESRENLIQHAGWLDNFPLEILRSRKIVDATDDVAVMVDKLLRFFRVSGPGAFEQVWLKPQASYKRSEAFEIDPYCTALWLRLASVRAEKVAQEAPEYSAKQLRAAAGRLREATQLPTAEGFVLMERLMLDAGVILVFVPEVPGTRISGVSLWLPSDRPMIALTNRYKYLDSIWFSLAHEIGHVLLHLKRATFLDGHVENLGDSTHYGDSSDTHETAANAFAEQLFLGTTGKESLARLSTVYELHNLADKLQVAPNILAGQYGYTTKNWKRFGKLRTRVDLESEIPSTP